MGVLWGMANKEDANVHRVSSKHNNYYFLLQNTIFPLFLELPQILYYVFHIFCGCSKRSGKNWSNSVCATIFVAAPKKWQKSAYGVYATIFEAKLIPYYMCHNFCAYTDNSAPATKIKPSCAGTASIPLFVGHNFCGNHKICGKF